METAWLEPHLEGPSKGQIHSNERLEGAKARTICPQTCTSCHIRSGSLADISQCNRHVRFTPKSGHSLSNRRAEDARTSAILTGLSSKSAWPGNLSLENGKGYVPW